MLGAHDDDTVDVFTSGSQDATDLLTQYRRQGALKKGQTRGSTRRSPWSRRAPEAVGEISTLREVLSDGHRALVVGHADEERIVWLAEPLVAAEDMAPEVAPPSTRISAPQAASG